MSENNFSGVVESLLKGANAVLSTKTVVGEATQVGDTIILPLVDVTFGIGAGASAGCKNEGSSGNKKNSGAGAFSAKMSPSAVLVIKGGYTKLVNVKNQDTVTKIIDLIPDIIDRFTSPKEGGVDDDEAVNIAFPDKDKDKKEDADKEEEK